MTLTTRIADLETARRTAVTRRLTAEREAALAWLPGWLEREYGLDFWHWHPQINRALGLVERHRHLSPPDARTVEDAAPVIRAVGAELGYDPDAAVAWSERAFTAWQAHAAAGLTF